jgi:uncharacterized protein YndB with AHSA1/START domain
VADVRVTRTFDVPDERLYDAFLDPAQARRFLFATAAGEMVRADIDARVGGHFTLTDRRDGEDVEHSGEYVELERPRRIVFDFRVPKYSSQTTRMTIEIEDGTVTVTQHDAPEEMAEKIRAGWGSILERLAHSLIP